jgi:hypothetical protein
MSDLARSWSIRPRLTIRTMILAVAAIAPSFAFYGASFGFAPALRLATALPARVAVVGWWNVAAALPALWVGDVWRTPPKGLLLRFAIGNTFLGALVGAGSALLVVILLGVAVLVPSFGWCTMSLMSPGPQRVQVERATANFSSYVIQLALTVALFLLTLVPLGWL